MDDARRFTLILGSKNLSSWSLRPWIAMRMAGIAFQETVIALDQPETRAGIGAHSPSGLVPALHDGSLTIWDSLAILEYVHEEKPQAGLWPADRTRRAWARSVAAEMHSGFSALRQTMPMDFARTGLSVEVTPAVQKDIDRVMTIWSDARAAHGADGAFLFGPFTAADAMYAPVVSRFRTYGVALPPALKAYADAMWSLPAMQEWLADSRAEIAA